jgi:hypothetical protein
MARLDEIASSVPNHRTPDPVEVGNDQFSVLSFSDGFAGIRIDDFSDEFTFVDVDPAGVELALKPKGANLRGASMIEAFGPPRILNHCFGTGNARSRLTGVNRNSHR